MRARIPNDGTFDQSRPLKFVRHKSSVFSFDLKSATDRWPLAIMIKVFGAGRELAQTIVEYTLGCTDFRALPPLVSKPQIVSFNAGQVSSISLLNAFLRSTIDGSAASSRP